MYKNYYMYHQNYLNCTICAQMYHQYNLKCMKVRVQMARREPCTICARMYHQYNLKCMKVRVQMAHRKPSTTINMHCYKYLQHTHKVMVIVKVYYHSVYMLSSLVSRPRLPLFLARTLKRLGEPGNESTC